MYYEFQTVVSIGPHKGLCDQTGREPPCAAFAAANLALVCDVTWQASAGRLAGDGAALIGQKRQFL